jgi:hypothetical protein
VRVCVSKIPTNNVQPQLQRQNELFLTLVATLLYLQIVILQSQTIQFQSHELPSNLGHPFIGSFKRSENVIKGHSNNTWHFLDYFRPPPLCAIWWHKRGPLPGTMWKIIFDILMAWNVFKNYEKSHFLPKNVTWHFWKKTSPLCHLVTPKVSRIFWMAPKSKNRFSLEQKYLQHSNLWIKFKVPPSPFESLWVIIANLLFCFYIILEI